MAPTKPPRSDKERRPKAILLFAANLEAQLSTTPSLPTQGALLNELQNHVLTFPEHIGKSIGSRCEEIDANGTSLWNLCTRLRRAVESDNPRDTPIILLVARVFAFQLLDAALEAGKSTTANVLRLMKIGIKAAKDCLEMERIDLATKVFEKLGAYEIKLGNPDADSPAGDAAVHRRLIAEYYVLRTALAWRQDNLSMADHMFNKSMSSRQLFDSNTAESLADVLYEMGKDLLHKKQYELAAKWLERAVDVLAGQELDRLSRDASELRMSILESNIKALLQQQTQRTTEKARKLVDLLESEVGDKLIVLLLKIDLLSSTINETFDSNAYADILRRMIRSTVLNGENFKLLMYHIRKLNEMNPSLACRALDDLLTLRVLPEDKDDWIEKILITRLYMAIGQGDGDDVVAVLDDLFTSILTNFKQPISSAATLAAHTLLWKKIESNYTQNQHAMTAKWCRLALHQIFGKSGQLNSARISRKLLLCALATQDFGSARDTYGSMSEIVKNEPMTRFLMYKVAIRCEETELAADCLQTISSSSKDLTLLYACVLDAQQIGDKLQTLAALQLVLEKFGYGAPSSIHFPSLLRLTIGLTASLIDKSRDIDGSPEADETVEKLCKLFEGGVASMLKAPRNAQTTEVFWTIAELDWFSKNSYNLSIEHFSSWSPRHSLRMLQCCIAFIDQYPADIGEQVSDDLSLRKMFCQFSAATALIALARRGDHVVTCLQHYLNLRKHVASFDSLLQTKLEKMEDGPAQDLLQKLSVLVAFDFEAACRLKAWDDLGEVILRAQICREMRIYELMADCILCSQPPTEVLVTTLKKIVNEAWLLNSLDSIKLAKYMRCLFQVALSDSPDTAAKLIDQICAHAQATAETEQPYPPEELEWVATRAFNHAVDLYCSGDNDDACKNWAGRALNAAHLCADGGALERLFQTKWAGLKFDADA